MNKYGFLDDTDWRYWHSISIDSSKIWHTNNFKNISEEKYFYDLMLESIKEKQKIEDIYNF